MPSRIRALNTQLERSTISWERYRLEVERLLARFDYNRRVKYFNMTYLWGA